jgi:ADP-heptose:LPS heptosyltransferase/glycosyltransferase involved in cell wall biosynthesis/2-polyprenyl-3-methyl-5-hydroxy-6-metoxy-1,4-benzoquinol methylase
MNSLYGIAVFHNVGDILLCTPIARQLKADEPNCEITWFTAEKYQFVLENNPYIDRVVSFEGDPVALDACIPQLKSQQAWTRFFTPAAHMNYDKIPGQSIPELVRNSADFNWTVPFVPVVRLSETEKAQAATYWNALPSGKKILIETEFGSQQTPLNQQFLDRLFEVLSPIRPVFIFTAKNKPVWIETYQAKYSNVVWCQEPFRLNAEFYNRCDAFIGVSSGISCLSNSDCCRQDVPHLEISRGYHWSNASYPSRKKELYVSYSLSRFEEGLYWLFDRLTGSKSEHSFAPRFNSISQVAGNKEIIPCTLCGSADFVLTRVQDIVLCKVCGNVYLRHRMNRAAMEKYYSDVYAVNQPAAACPVRVPRSREEIDILDDCIGAQRRGVLAEIQSLLGVDLKGKSLIDIGCGWGAFLHNARNRGMKVMGFEFTRPNVEFGRNVLGIDIRPQQFIEADIPENSIDMIVMNHSLEHVPYPFEFLEKIDYVLRPGGVFFCMVPNFESLCSDVLREKWAWIERDWHYTHFTPMTLKDTLAQTGFYIEKLYTTSGDYGDDTPVSVLKRIKPGLSEPEYRRMLEQLHRHGKGEQINAIAVKRGSSKGRVMVQNTAVRQIIWQRTDSIGDAVLSSSMLPYIRKKYPAAEITVVCQEHIAELYESCYAVNRIISIPTEHRWKDQRQYEEFLETIRALKPDLLLNSVYSVHGLADLKGLEFIPRRIALRQSSTLKYTDIIQSPGVRKSEMQRHQDFLAGLGISSGRLEASVWITQADIDYADQLLLQSGINPKNTIAFFAGTRTNNRSYDGYGRALQPFVQHLGCSVIALGGAGEHAINQAQLDSLKTKTVNLSGRLTLRQSAAILSRCRLAFGAETGLAHMAAAVGVPHVILIGGGHFGRFMPHSPLTSLVCLPLDCYGCDWSCRHKEVRCIQGVEPSLITRALNDCIAAHSDKTRIYLQGEVPCQYDNRLLTSDAMAAFVNPGGGQCILVYDSTAGADRSIGDDSCDVSIVLATRDRAKLLDMMLSSLKAAVEGIRCEIIVIEGGSSDDTVQVLHRHGITQIYNESQCLGPGRHTWPQLYNFGFSKARGKWAMYASDDIVFGRESVGRAVELLNRQADDVAGGIFFYKNAKAEPGWDQFGIDFTYGPKLLMNYGLVRLDDFKQVGGLDEGYKFYCADGDLCYKLYQSGKRLIPLPGCFVVHNNVLDVQKKVNTDNSGNDIELYKQKWKHFVSMETPNPRRLFWRDDIQHDTHTHRNDILGQIKKLGIWNESGSLRLHLGCGQQHLNGYVNIDYPPSEHTVQQTQTADIFADITQLDFPSQHVDEIRLHHVFEHFDRPAALALLCKWHLWLKTGGRLVIETPDFDASIDLIRSGRCSYQEKQAILRHLFGSHEADWAVHKDGWYGEKFQSVFGRLGFDDIRVEFNKWGITRNVTVSAVKAKPVSLEALADAAKQILGDSMIDQSQSEKKQWGVWCRKLDEALNKGLPAGTKPPLVSIYMSMYNTGQYLSETLDSIIGQTFTDWELVIVDDGSSDNSLEIARNYQTRDSRIRVIAIPHAGVVRARNEALRQCHPQSTYLMNHDSDDISMPDKLRRLVEYLNTHPDIAVVGCFARYFGEFVKGRQQPHLEWRPEAIARTFAEFNSMIHSASMIRRAVVNTVGQYRHEFPAAEDYDFFARALMAGFKCANIPEVLHQIRLHRQSLCAVGSETMKVCSQRVSDSYRRYLQNSGQSRLVLCGDVSAADSVKTVQPRGRRLAQSPAGTVSDAAMFRPSNDSSLTILHTVEFYAPHTGGAEEVVRQISERLAKRGHRVTVATTKLGERNFSELNGVRIREFDIAGNYARGFQGRDINSYVQLVRSDQFDVMLNYAAQQWATDLAFAGLESAASQRINIIAPCGYSALSDAKTLRLPQYAKYFDSIIPVCLPRYDAAVYHSAMYKDYEFAANHGFTNSIVIPNGTSEEEFSTPCAVDFRQKYEISTKYMGLCVANFFAGKGHPKVIEAVRQMHRPDLTLVFIGKEGQLLPELRTLAAGLNIRFCVNIPRQDTVAAYQAADMFLFGSEIEASPLVIIEAKASRTPFVTTDVGNVREWKGGIVCAPDKMAYYANSLLDNESMRENLADEGWKEWKEKLTWESVTDRYEQLYLSLKNTKRKGLHNDFNHFQQRPGLAACGDHRVVSAALSGY